MSLAALTQSTATLSAARAKNYTHVLVLLSPDHNAGSPASSPQNAGFLGSDVLQALLKRRSLKIDALKKTPQAGILENGTAIVWATLDTEKPAFEQHTQVRKALQPLLDESPSKIAIDIVGNDATWRRTAAERAVYAAWLNGVTLPERKKKPSRKLLKQIDLFGFKSNDNFAALHAQAAGNTLTRELTVLPPNELTPSAYRARIRKLVQANKWKITEYDFNKLKRMGAGAFCAVAQGSDANGGGAAIVHLRYSNPKAKKHIALVGKGICFDTGGHNLKPARYMYSMHEDMNGSAVALGILRAATELKLPFTIDCWLAIAQNHISPTAYKQNDVVKALDGTTIEIIHTDAEGRMVLSDTLTLASRAKPDLILDFATLTGSMHTALGDRYSGVFATSDELAEQAVNAGKVSGERVIVFPQDEDYGAPLESSIADVKQCTLEGGGDHIQATLLMKRFTNNRPWIHMDLSASNTKGGLGAVASDVTGFGVGWALELLKN